MQLQNIFLQTAKASADWTTPILMGMMIVVFYFFMIRPQAKKAKEQIAVLAGNLSKLNTVYGNMLGAMQAK